MEEIDQTKYQEKFIKRLDCEMKWDKKRNQEQIKMINGKGKNI